MGIDYLREQVRVLLEQQEKDNRILLNNTQRRRLAVKAGKLTRKLLEETTVLFTPDTVLGWYRKHFGKRCKVNQINNIVVVVIIRGIITGIVRVLAKPRLAEFHKGGYPLDASDPCI